MNQNDLSEFGSRFFDKSNGSLLISKFSPPSLTGRISPSGMTFISDKNRSLQEFFPFEGEYKYSNKWYYFAPKIHFSYNLLQTLFNKNIPKLDDIISVEVQKVNSNISINFSLLSHNKFPNKECTLQEQGPLPFVYRTLRGNITGISTTVIKNANHKNLSIFLPFPDYCKINMKELSTNCTFIQPISKYQFYVKGDNCTFTYPYRCQFLHYSQYPQNPDRGLVLGAVIVESENNLWYGNTENLRIPTPDFSMVYNTPVISGIVFSLTFAYILRMRFQTKTEKKKDKEEEKQD